MPIFPRSSFEDDWVYAIEKDFTSPDGTPATYATGQPVHYGEEAAKIDLTSAYRASSLNSDGTLLAVGQKHDIHVYNVEDQALLHVLRGHISQVDVIDFHPTDAQKLISCAMCSWGGSVEAESTILFWDLSEYNTKGLLTDTTLDQVSQRAVDGAVEGLETVGSYWRPSDQEKATLMRELAKSIETLNIKSLVQNKDKLHGRLSGSFGSRPFNRDGSSMIFLPGERPRSNTVDDGWVICIWDTLRKETKLTLGGHTDSLMWVGFSPDDRYIGSVSWDRTFRVWSHAGGRLLHTFRSESQNWTGGFSPDSRFFAGTGVGKLWVWDIIHGVEVATYTWTGGWMRQLDWSPNGKQILIAGEDMGSVLIFDVKTQRVVQERLLSLEKCGDDVRKGMRHQLEVNWAQYMDKGRKLVYRTSGDNSVEVYDFELNQKWRFAPGKGQGAWAEKVHPLEKQKMIASVDADGVRFWKLDAGK